MEPVRVRGGSTRASVVVGTLVLACVIAAGAAPRFLEGGSVTASAGQAAEALTSPGLSATPSARTLVRLPLLSTAVRPSYPPPAVISSTFSVEIRGRGRVLTHFELRRQPDGSQIGSIPIAQGWRSRPPLVELLGRTAPTDRASRLFS